MRTAREIENPGGLAVCGSSLAEESMRGSESPEVMSIKSKKFWPVTLRRRENQEILTPYRGVTKDDPRGKMRNWAGTKTRNRKPNTAGTRKEAVKRGRAEESRHDKGGSKEAEK